jgi:hypothetical protein
MLEDHLRHGITQKHHVLVKRLYLALKFDPIHQVDRHWYVLPTQGVQEWILQKLTFVVHDILRVREI